MVGQFEVLLVPDPTFDRTGPERRLRSGGGIGSNVTTAVFQSAALTLPGITSRVFHLTAGQVLPDC